MNPLSIYGRTEPRDDGYDDADYERWEEAMAELDPEDRSDFESWMEAVEADRLEEAEERRAEMRREQEYDLA